MAYITSDWQPYDGEPDWDVYKPTEEHVDLTAVYIVDVAEVSHDEALTYYLTLPDGSREQVDASTVDAPPECTTGTDMHTVIDTPEQGHWSFKRGEVDWDDCPATPEEWWSHESAYTFSWTYTLIEPYTKQERQKRAEERAQQEQEQEEQAAQAEMVAALPDAVAELSELAADNTTDVEVLSDAIAELSTLVAEILESNNG